LKIARGAFAREKRSNNGNQPMPVHVETGYRLLTTGERLALGFMYACILVAWLVTIFGVAAFTQLFETKSVDAFQAVPLIVGGIAGIVLFSLCLVQFKQLEVMRRISASKYYALGFNPRQTERLERVLDWIEDTRRHESGNGQARSVERILSLLESMQNGQQQSSQQAALSSKVDRVLSIVESMRTRGGGVEPAQTVTRLDRVISLLENTAPIAQIMEVIAEQNTQITAIAAAVREVRATVEGAAGTAILDRLDAIDSRVRALPTAESINAAVPPQDERLARVLALLERLMTERELLDPSSAQDVPADRIFAMLEAVGPDGGTLKLINEELLRLKGIVAQLEDLRDQSEDLNAEGLVERLDRVIAVLESVKPKEELSAALARQTERLDQMLGILERAQSLVVASDDGDANAGRLDRIVASLEQLVQPESPVRSSAGVSERLDLLADALERIEENLDHPEVLRKFEEQLDQLLQRIEQSSAGISAVAAGGETAAKLERIVELLEPLAAQSSRSGNDEHAERLDQIVALVQSFKAAQTSNGNGASNELTDKLDRIVHALEGDRAGSSNLISADDADKLDRIIALLEERRGEEGKPAHRLVSCPFCGQHMLVPKKFHRSTGRCTRCQLVFPLG
jgi:hypothetical protein